MTISFKEFVMSQPADRIIDQSCGWEHCAIGDYDSEILGHTTDHTGIFETVEMCIGDDKQLRACLAGYGKPLREYTDYDYLCDHERETIINRYGDLQDYYNGKLNLFTGEKSV